MDSPRLVARACLQATRCPLFLLVVRNLLFKGDLFRRLRLPLAIVGPTRGGRCPASQQRVRGPLRLLPCTVNPPSANTHLVLGEVLFSCLRRQEVANAAEPIETSEYGFSELVLLQKGCVPHLGSATCIIVIAVPNSCFHSVVAMLAPHTRRIFTCVTSRCLKPNHSQQHLLRWCFCRTSFNKNSIKSR